ncbi:tetratricopeptide-like helical domain containing protein, partial [Tanacetum coccineum]
MAVIGNLALLLDVTSPRTTTTLPDRTRLLPSDLILTFFKNNNNLHASISSKGGIEFDKEANRTGRLRKKANSKFNEVDYESSSDEENNGYEDVDDVEAVMDEERRKRMEWEKEMRIRVKEIEDSRELEKKAEEYLQSGGDDGGEDEEEEETEEEKRMRVRRELEKVAKEQAERRKMAQLMFDLGQRAYGKGMYGRSIEYLEGALTIIPRPTLFGGEIQIWLAMAYEANNRHKDCIDLYRKLESSHPSLSIRRQAKDLRYILQAPKL